MRLVTVVVAGVVPVLEIRTGGRLDVVALVVVGNTFVMAGSAVRLV